ncbi:MAG: signal peptidase I [Erysipelotrichia bacterium]|nr:signal peptidase I [Candidatus Riflebacteria bacterium]NCB38799.1 signal peptidase I [Erysipelotrichia bacterium]
MHYKGSFREWNETIFIAFFLAILIRSLVVQAFWIPTGSMEPTLLGEKRNPFSGQLERGGDRILVSRFAYVFDLSLDGRVPFAPRIWLKMPERGDIVVFRYPNPDMTAPPKDYIKRVVGLPGDHIDIEDGVVAINGVALNEPYIAEPPLSDFATVVPEDSLFVMGDNRNNSSDSRFWGPMPLANLKGQAVFNYLPLNRTSPIRSFPHSLHPEQPASHEG